MKGLQSAFELAGRVAGDGVRPAVGTSAGNNRRERLRAGQRAEDSAIPRTAADAIRSILRSRSASVPPPVTNVPLATHGAGTGGTKLEPKWLRIYIYIHIVT